MGYSFSKSGVAEAVYNMILECATRPRADVLDAIISASHIESNERGKTVLGQLVENARIAKQDHVPLCQDTGTVWVRLEVNNTIAIPGNIFDEIDDAVARAYQDGKLRMSVLEDALFNRVNTKTNTPAFKEIAITDTDSVRLSVMLKGGGSDNASRVVMLAPGDGREGVKQVLLDCVREKAANACPPLLIGVGIGSTFDKVAGLAKHALLRPIGSPAQSPEHQDFEDELLGLVNSTGIGPGALGGDCTALAVHLETAPCHIAALPVAVNMGCSAMRSATVELEVI